MRCGSSGFLLTYFEEHYKNSLHFKNLCKCFCSLNLYNIILYPKVLDYLIIYFTFIFFLFFLYTLFYFYLLTTTFMYLYQNYYIRSYIREHTGKFFSSPNQIGLSEITIQSINDAEASRDHIIRHKHLML